MENEVMEGLKIAVVATGLVGLVVIGLTLGM